jgi:hypothetical protein
MTRYRLSVLFLSVSLLVSLTAAAQDQDIDFETLPDGTPVSDGMFITDAYMDWGVTFELIGAAPGLGPRIAEVGPPRTAFLGVSRTVPECGVNSSTQADTPAPGEEVGCFFLTDDNIHNTSAYGLRVNYLTPVMRAYGELLDIDATEIWTVRSLRADDTVIEEFVFEDGDPETGDGIATPWYFDSSEEIFAVELIPDTGTQHNFGLAFDNFSPSSIPFFPVCAAGGPYSGSAGEPIQFDGSGSYDPDGEISSYAWDFGDGQSGSGVAPTHTYVEDGAYTVTLCVTDNDGNVSCCATDESVVPAEEMSWGVLKANFR